MSLTRLDGASVHRLCSGQVVLDLTTAVKELVENALDANASHIEVRFRNFGLDSIEVIDNGAGIPADDYESIALKHFTSKLRQFEDLTTVDTFGFRGEALSSLCALADVFITTTQKHEEPKATQLEFEKNGHLKCRSITSGKRGTSVTINRLFESLPVRRREFERHHKREFTKAVSLLQAYAVAAVGVKFLVTNTPPSGKKASQITTNGGKHLRDNITNVFGAKVMSSLMPVEFAIEDIDLESCLKFGGQSNSPITLKVSGFISKPDVGEGRSSSDRQLLFINNRPCGLSKLSRSINDIYGMFNSNQNPVFVLNLRLPFDSYDVNVTPDKRTIFLHGEDTIVETVKLNLLQIFEACSRNVARQPQIPYTAEEPTELAPEPSKQQKELRTEKDSHARDTCPGHPYQHKGTSSEDSHSTVVIRKPSKDNMSGDNVDRTLSVNVEPGDLKRRFTNWSSSRTIGLCAASVKRSRSTLPDMYNVADELIGSKRRATISSFLSSNVIGEVSGLGEAEEGGEQNDAQSCIGAQEQVGHEMTDESILPASEQSEDCDAGLAQLEAAALSAPGSQVRSAGALFAASPSVIHKRAEPAYRKQHSDLVTVRGERRELLGGDKSQPDQSSVNHDAMESPFDRAQVLLGIERPAIWSKKAAVHELSLEVSTSLEEVKRKLKAIVITGRKTSAAASDDNDILEDITADGAEERLSTSVTKADFAEMRIIGQFNLGFIIVARAPMEDDPPVDRVDDIFIVDQHASDEKYNFERLQAETVIQHQPLVRPKALDLTAIEELVVAENLDVVRRNGFEVVVDDDGPTGRKCTLIGLPMSKNTIFTVKGL
ncbi:ATP-binding mismatch repair protein [Saitoella coloradoensis]